MINDLKDLEKLLKLARKHGVTEIKLGSCELKLGDVPLEPGKAHTVDEAPDPYKNFPIGELTPDQLMFYSSGGVPEDDPALKVNAS